MSNKPGGKGGGGGGAAGKAKKPAKGGVEEKREDALQAVVCIVAIDTRTCEPHMNQLLMYIPAGSQILADSFLDRFRPFSLERPRVSLALAPKSARFVSTRPLIPPPVPSPLGEHAHN